MSSSVLHIVKGDGGGLDVISAEISNKTGGSALLLRSNRKEKMYERARSINCYCLDSEIIFPKFREISTFLREIKKSNIIHIHITNLIILFMWPILFNKKVVFTIHKNFGIGYEYLYLNSGKRFLFNLFREISMFTYLNYITLVGNKIILLTNAQYSYFESKIIFKEIYRSKSEVIPNFITPLDTNFIRKNKNNKLNVIFVGRLSKYKGFQDVIKIINDLSNNFNYTIIGKGSLAREVPHRANIKFIEEVDNKKIHKFYNTADILLLPSYTEVFPMTVLEAMYSGLVILVSDLPGMNEIVKSGKNGYRFTPGDVNEIKRVLLNLDGNRQKLEDISKNNRRDIKKFYSKNIIKLYSGLYKRLASK